MNGNKIEQRSNPEIPGTEIELSVVEPRGDKNFMIAFTALTKNKCMAYNWAIEQVLKREDLQPFHQVGATSPNGNHEPGYHAWEVWQKTDKERLTALLPEIIQRAKEHVDIFGHFNAEIE
ncbi:MAG: hypothetical protein A3A80_01010 [Candidatus Terrybacteria bacterium RIFCSPLOWO2_01_FULL_44_24]|uniref:Uncharacterized protein n=1 Tax=Candidatus Terrybacteria bacterium RIFCSPHIGHO2_01_FULL_43_35 TaxID=1802361 RepID=A0A1G2PFM1_9BACT|nr:MAG: hypothetical protein A2828_04115 [Candidatus Terrybacteria bacterium RIFCSPHIGHO2_01_FULL_43_35]OHA49885.1 MAG: hypothetical protein A3B75_03190 [Candidatus Terrybacteria bacterium RIFCSPHIGHO2_02_FULL_43_14]OHA50720.1 MAG: hypothetical protein A3A80_01010 [Candidatus Terrybacteria bacterium RIFCSPLOWO2_01_FULL_44_24]